MFDSIIKSCLDNDFYKFTQQYAILTLFGTKKPINVEYKFYCRNRGVKFTNTILKKIQNSIYGMKYLHFQIDELEYLYKFFPKWYIDELNQYQYDPNEVDVSLTRDGQLDLTISGPWWRTILWEVPLLATISEIYNKEVRKLKARDLKYYDISTQRKFNYFESTQASFADFGTRRRYSHVIHDRMLSFIKDTYSKKWIDTKFGTSNLYFAKKYGFKPVGTQAHEWFMAHAALYGYEKATEAGLKNWKRVFGPRYSIALSDTFTSNEFFSKFGKYIEVYDGVRHDSGDPISFISQYANCCRENNIDPSSKKIVFSNSIDNLNIIINIFKNILEYGFEPSFGIGTWLVNDFSLLDSKPLNIVIKLDSLNGKKCVKLSNDKGKITGDEIEVSKCKKELGIK